MRALTERAAQIRAKSRSTGVTPGEVWTLYKIEREIEQDAQRHETREGQAGGRPLADAAPTPDTVSG